MIGSFQINANFLSLTNMTIADYVGNTPKINAQIAYGSNAILQVNRLNVAAEKLQLVGNGRLVGDRITAKANGSHQQFGDFDLNMDTTLDNGRVTLALANPYPALDVKNMVIDAGIAKDSINIDTNGQSMLGAFNGTANIFSQGDGTTHIAIPDFKVSKTRLVGDIYTGDNGLSGQFNLAGGGINGEMALASSEAGQSINADLTMKNALFEGETPIRINRGTIIVDAQLAENSNKIKADYDLRGIGRGNMFIGRLNGNADIINGEGMVKAHLDGQSDSEFFLDLDGKFTSNKITVDVSGKHRKMDIAFAKPLVLTAISEADGGGWRMGKNTLKLARGRIDFSGQMGGLTNQISATLRRIPLNSLDIIQPNLGMGGMLFADIDYSQSGNGAPQLKADVNIARLTRAGLVLSSRPVDLAANVAMNGQSLSLRTVINEQKTKATLGKMQLHIGNLPETGTLMERFSNGRMQGQMRFKGPADSLWRLTGVEVFDITGIVAVQLDLAGSLNNPSLTGALGSENARLEGVLSGTNVENIRVFGKFNGTELRITEMTGTAPNGGKVNGTGKIDYGGLFGVGGREGVAMDFSINAKNALLVNRDDFGAAITGNIKVSSPGNGGLLSGDVVVNSGKFMLGEIAAVEQLPQIAYREVNLPADVAPKNQKLKPWRFDLKARSDGLIKVRGLGMVSEWEIEDVLAVKGPVDAMRMTGQVSLVRGEYDFGGRRFDLDRGRITFRGSYPIDPALDVVANASLSGIDANINVRGTGYSPEITFSSVPAMPEDELLAQLLFGTSIKDISAPEALQLASALNSLRGGGGLDPINAVRGAIGLDRLRIVSADPSTGQGTSLAAGKYITRDLYAEVVSDGQGYSATNVEFQITSWLSLLSTISTIGRQSANLRVSHDY